MPGRQPLFPPARMRSTVSTSVLEPTPFEPAAALSRRGRKKIWGRNCTHCGSQHGAGTKRLKKTNPKDASKNAATEASKPAQRAQRADR